jgi:hypothetical protein
MRRCSDNDPTHRIPDFPGYWRLRPVQPDIRFSHEDGRARKEWLLFWYRQLGLRCSKPIGSDPWRCPCGSDDVEMDLLCQVCILLELFGHIDPLCHSGPIIAVAMAVTFSSMPTFDDGKTNAQRIRELGIYGDILSVCWPIPFIFALQEAGVLHPWISGVIVGPLTAGIVLLVLLGLYETWVTFRTQRYPIFSIYFLRNPPIALTLL